MSSLAWSGAPSKTGECDVKVVSKIGGAGGAEEGALVLNQPLALTQASKGIIPLPLSPPFAVLAILIQNPYVSPWQVATIDSSEE